MSNDTARYDLIVAFSLDVNAVRADRVRPICVAAYAERIFESRFGAV
jgi:hypothetical protein